MPPHWSFGICNVRLVWPAAYFGKHVDLCYKHFLRLLKQPAHAQKCHPGALTTTPAAISSITKRIARRPNGAHFERNGLKTTSCLFASVGSTKTSFQILEAVLYRSLGLSAMNGLDFHTKMAQMPTKRFHQRARGKRMVAILRSTKKCAEKSTPHSLLAKASYRLKSTFNKKYLELIRHLPTQTLAVTRFTS